MTAMGRGCVKTQKRPLEIDFKLGKLSVEDRRLLTGPYRHWSRSTVFDATFDSDFCHVTGAEFSHSLGNKQPDELVAVDITG